MNALREAVRAECAEVGPRGEPLARRAVRTQAPERRVLPPKDVVAAKPVEGASRDGAFALVLGSQALAGEARAALVETLARAIDLQDWASARRALEIAVTGVT